VSQIRGLTSSKERYVFKEFKSDKLEKDHDVRKSHVNHDEEENRSGDITGMLYSGLSARYVLIPYNH
jgi:hypothetical protein